MLYLDFRDKFLDIGCVNINHILIHYPSFNRNNLTRWVSQGLLLKLRQGYYTFPELAKKANFNLFVSNRIYRPSYISLHTALAFYGLIPEAIIDITAVTSLNTANFENSIGSYSYQKIKSDLFFGYERWKYNNTNILIAFPEKAILDLLYLYSFYNTEQEIEELRFDEYFLSNELSIQRLDEYTALYKNKALEKRVKILKKVYGI